MNGWIDNDALCGTPLGRLLTEEGFRFNKLVIDGIDNTPVFEVNVADMPLQEITLFRRTVASGNDYVTLLSDRVEAAMRERSPLPLARFADGEYEFYTCSLKCNGLYRQAESIAAIRAALPAHMEALRYLTRHGVVAPMLFPGNIQRRRGLRRLFGKKNGNDTALRFLEFLEKAGLKLTASNYIPFYVVYAYLSGARFAQAVSGKTVCIVNSDYNAAACAEWFERAGSRPKLIHIPISDSYVATRWDAMREDVFRNVPGNPDCFMVGAGVGALQICVDAARRFSAPAIDSGHILNIMNDLERKSQGPRLFTFRR